MLTLIPRFLPLPLSAVPGAFLALLWMQGGGFAQEPVASPPVAVSDDGSDPGNPPAAGAAGTGAGTAGATLGGRRLYNFSSYQEVARVAAFPKLSGEPNVAYEKSSFGSGICLRADTQKIYVLSNNTPAEILELEMDGTLAPDGRIPVTGYDPEEIVWLGRDTFAISQEGKAGEFKNRISVVTIPATGADRKVDLETMDPAANPGRILTIVLDGPEMEAPTNKGIEGLAWNPVADEFLFTVEKQIPGLPWRLFRTSRASAGGENGVDTRTFTTGANGYQAVFDLSGERAQNTATDISGLYYSAASSTLVVLSHEGETGSPTGPGSLQEFRMDGTRIQNFALPNNSRSLHYRQAEGVWFTGDARFMFIASEPNGDPSPQFGVYKAP